MVPATGVSGVLASASGACDGLLLTASEEGAVCAPKLATGGGSMSEVSVELCTSGRSGERSWYFPTPGKKLWVPGH